MTMLPTTPQTLKSVVILVALPGSDQDADILVSLGAKAVLDSGVMFDLSGIGVLALPQAQISDEILGMCDGFLVVIDGDLGLAPHVIDLWRHSLDMSIPRHIAVMGSIRARADFDEVIAIAKRVLEPDLLVRYLPIESEHDDSVVGLYDILTAEIHDHTDHAVTIAPADPEHIALTAERRDELFNELAYLADEDYVHQQHEQGLPISVTALERAWMSLDVVSVTPIDNSVGQDIIRVWCNTVAPRWVATLSSKTDQAVLDTVAYGVGITRNIARVWNMTDDQSVYLGNTRNARIVALAGGLAYIPDIELHDTFVQSGQELDVVIPRF